MSNEGSDDEVDLEMVPIVSQNNNNNNNVISDSNRGSNDKNQEKFFDENVNKER